MRQKAPFSSSRMGAQQISTWSRATLGHGQISGRQQGSDGKGLESSDGKVVTALPVQAECAKDQSATLSSIVASHV